MLNLKTLVFGAVIAAASVSAMARPPVADHTPNIDARQAEQAARIDRALHDGRLSRREFRSLQREQAAIRRYEAHAKADGIVTRTERRELQQMLDRASRHIRSS
jgi:type IV secretory pathway VirD2 relaxase